MVATTPDGAPTVRRTSPGSGGSSPAAYPPVGVRKFCTAADWESGELRGGEIGGGSQPPALRLNPLNASRGEYTDSLSGDEIECRMGAWTSAEVEAPHPFNAAILSWNAEAPFGTWLQAWLSAYRPDEGRWTKYYSLGVWTSEQGEVRRHSVSGQDDADAVVETDVLRLSSGAVYNRYKCRTTLYSVDAGASPSVTLLAVSLSAEGVAARAPERGPGTERAAWGVVLDVPPRSQMIYVGGDAWCSPTSTAMVLAYWGFDVPVLDAAAATYDCEYCGTGAWPFNTAWASTFGLEAYVARMTSLAELERWIVPGVPVVVSLGFGPGELDGAPLERSSGHLIVVCGFDVHGDVVVNDPAAKSDAEVRLVYRRSQLERQWLAHSGGVVYLIHPRRHE